MSGLTGEHSDLSSMMGVVRDQITEEASNVGTKAFNATIGVE